MKKAGLNMTATLGLLSALLLISCNKEAFDGIYKPDKQIAKIRYETEMMTSTETWIWNDDRLEKILYNNDMNGGAWKMDSKWEMWGMQTYSSLDFYYDGDRLSKIIADDGTISTISYQDGKFSEIKVENVLLGTSGTFTFTHSNGKMKTVTYNATFNGWIDIPFLSMGKMLEFLLPAHTSDMFTKEVVQIVQDAAATKASLFDTKIVMKFTWNGNNIKKATISTTEFGEKDKEILTYTYDNKKNPYCRFFGGGFKEASTFGMEYSFGAEYASANNVIRIKSRFSDEVETYLETITYEYDKDNYPIKRTSDFGETTAFIEYR